MMQQTLNVPSSRSSTACSRTRRPARRLKLRVHAAPSQAAAAARAPPPALLDAIRAAQSAWVKACLEQPLLDEPTNSSVHVFGVSTYAPLQWEGLADAFKRLQPTHVAIEQPPGACAPGLLLTRPQWVAAVLDHFDGVVCRSTLDPSKGPPQPPGGDLALAELHEALVAASLQARVGKDIIDGFESFGFYPGLDFVLQPHHVTDALSLFGYLPGAEFVAAAQKSAEAGAQLACIDAPLKLQEGWVKAMVQGFDVQEGQLQSIKLNATLAANQELLHPAAAAWDEELGAAFAAQEANAGAAASSSGRHSSDGSSAEQASTSAAAAAAASASTLAFKVSRACGAATLVPEEAEVALSRQQLLQPLKYQHFALRTRHMAHQLRELCDGACSSSGSSSSNGTQGFGSGSASSEARMAAQQRQGSTEQPPKRKVVLAVVGRQHVPALRQLWGDKGSALWSDRMPRHFSPSTLDAAGMGASSAGV